jgi:hypothetical protein
MRFIYALLLIIISIFIQTFIGLHKNYKYIIFLEKI